MNIIFLRSNPIMPDPRVEKEINALLGMGNNVSAIGWNRNEKNKLNTKIEKKVGERLINLELFNLGGKFAGGIKNNIIPLIKFQFKLINYMIKNRKKIDIIHACDFDTVIPAYLISKFLKKKFVYDIFDFYIDAYSVPNKLKKIIKKIDFYMIKKADATIICTEERVNQIKGSKPQLIEVIHNSPAMRQLKVSDLHLHKSKTKIVYVGVLTGDRFLEEMIEQVKDAEELELHIGGFGLFQNKIEDMANKYRNIYYYGKLDYEDTLNLEMNCDVMFAIYNPNIMNHKYAAPNKFYEALMLGKPIVMAKGTGMSEIIENESFGIVIDYFKTENLIKEIRKIDLSFKADRTKGEKMNSYYNSNYEWEIMELRLGKVYNELKNKG